MDKETLLKLYSDLQNILDISSGWLYDDLLRNIGWGIIKFLVWINDWIEGVATTVVTLGGIYNSDDMTSFMDTLQPLAIGLFVVSITVLGFMFMFNKVEKRNEVVINILIAVSVILILPNVMGMMENLLQEGLDTVEVDGNISDNVLKRNIADVKYYLNSDFNYAGTSTEDTVEGNKNVLPLPSSPTDKNIGTSNYYYANRLSNPDMIEINEKLDVHDAEGWFRWTTEDWVNKLKDKKDSNNAQGKSGVGYDFLTNRLIHNGDGTTRMVKLSENTVPATNLGQQSYYRYHVNWAIAIAILTVTAFALIITTLKIGRSMFDLAFHQIYAMFTASTDITGGQRLKKVLTEIASTFAVIFIMIVLLKLFIIYAQWVNDLEQEIGVVGVIILLIAGAWALIDAPDIVQRTMGIDAGLRSGWQAMMGAYAGTKMAGAGVGMVGKGAGKAVRAGGKTAGGLSAGGYGLYKGMKNGKRNNHVSPIPPKGKGKGTKPNGQQFSMNTVNQPNGNRPQATIPMSGSQSSSFTGSVPNNTGPSPSSQQTAGNTNQTTTSNGPMIHDGHQGNASQGQQPRPTLLGENRTVQRVRHFFTKAHNTGYGIGQRLANRKPTIGQGKQIKKRGIKPDDIRNTKRD